MPDNVTLPGTGLIVASDEIGGFQFQRVKLTTGADGVADDVSSAAPLPVQVMGAADPVATDDTGTFSLIALLKRLLAKTPALGAAAPAASSPVSLPNDVTVGAAASIAAANTDLLTGAVSGWFDAANSHSVSIQVIGAVGITAGQIIFEQTNDITAAPNGNAWLVDENTSLLPTPNVAAIAITANTVRMFGGSVVARFVRVRVSTAFTGATVRVVGVFSQLPYQRPVQTVHQATAANFQVTADTELPAAAALADGAGNPTTPTAGVATLLFNGTTWDRQRSNINVLTGDTGARTATFTGANQTNFNARGAKILLNVGAVTGTSPTLVARVQISLDNGTTFVDMPGAVTASIVATGTYLLTIYPGMTAAANSVVNDVLPRTWRLAYTIGGTTPSFTLTNVQVTYTN